jgi:hypothetical protein
MISVKPNKRRKVPTRGNRAQGAGPERMEILSVLATMGVGENFHVTLKDKTAAQIQGAVWGIIRRALKAKRLDESKTFTTKGSKEEDGTPICIVWRRT